VKELARIELLDYEPPLNYVLPLGQFLRLGFSKISKILSSIFDAGISSVARKRITSAK